MIERRFPPGLSLLVTAVSLSGLAVLIGAVLDWHDEDAQLLIALATITILCEWFDFSLPNSRVSLSIAFIFAAGAVSGLSGVAIIASTAAIADYAAHRKTAIKAVFNEGVMLASGAAFVGFIEAFSSTNDPRDWMAVLGPALLGSVAAFGVNSVLVSMAISLDTRRQVWRVWSSGFRWLLPHYIILCALALLLAIAYDRWEIGGLALLVLPFAMAWLIVKQYSDRLQQVSVAPAESS